MSRCHKCRLGTNSRTKSHYRYPFGFEAVALTIAVGLHTVRDLTCSQCKTSLGWKYCTAQERSQRYKMGKFLLEMSNVVKLSHWAEIEDQNLPRSARTESAHTNWDRGSIDLATLADEDSRPTTPLMGKQVQGNLNYDDLEDLMLSWRDGTPRNRPGAM